MICEIQVCTFVLKKKLWQYNYSLKLYKYLHDNTLTLYLRMACHHLNENEVVREYYQHLIRGWLVLLRLTTAVKCRVIFGLTYYLMAQERSQM
jgi:hypothetical protein